MSQIMPAKLLPWIDARKRFRLSDAQVQMAREMGMNPKKLGRLTNNKQEPWKLPLPEFIEHCYYKRFGKRRPELVRSIERTVEENKRKQKQQKQRKVERRAAGEAAKDESVCTDPPANAGANTDLPF